MVCIKFSELPHVTHTDPNTDDVPLDTTKSEERTKQEKFILCASFVAKHTKKKINIRKCCNSKFV